MIDDLSEISLNDLAVPDVLPEDKAQARRLAALWYFLLDFFICSVGLVNC